MIIPIPETLEEAVSPAWLSMALGAEVTAVTTGTLDSRVSTNQLIHVEFIDGPARDLWIKGYFGDYGSAYRQAGVPEAMFYRELAGRFGVRTLRPVYAAADLDTQANIVITEDVLGNGSVFLNAMSEYSVDQTAESLEQLAILHESTWMGPGYTEMSWLAPRFRGYLDNRGIAEIEGNLGGPIGARVPQRAQDAELLYDAYKRVAADAVSATPWSVIHGDTHVGNVYLDGQGLPSFLDWQLVQRGPWYLDVGYHIASSLTVDDRRGNEHDLVRCYLDRLQGSGIEVPAGDDVWRGLRHGFIHGFYLWGITLKVDPRITAILLERLATAVDDHNAYREVGL